MAWVVPVLMGMQYVANAVCFYQFIMEEGIQAGVLGIYLTKKIKKQGHAAQIIEQLESNTIPALKHFNEFWGYLAPWVQPAFADFVKAAEISVKINKAQS